MKRFFILMCCYASPLIAIEAPNDEFLYALKASLVKVNTTTKSGGHGFGTAVAISPDHAVTNCHVLANANGVSISKWGTEYPADTFQADWKHDLCILKVSYANLKPVTLGDSAKLSYEQPLISISMPNDSPAPYVALGTVKALYPMDGEDVIRSEAAFSIGASGSPVFDYQGQLIGISTFKSPGKHAYFYNMPVNWVKRLMQAPSVALDAPHTLPFWDAPDEDRPYFMRIVLPFQNERWQDVATVAQAWVKQEPDNAEAWFYHATAIEHLQASDIAMPLYQKVLVLHPNHPAALQSLARIALKQGKLNDFEQYKLALQAIAPDLLENLDTMVQNKP